MAVSNMTAELSAAVENVWAVVTSTESGWRSDLREIRLVDERHFIEIDRNGFETRFTVTEAKPYSLLRYEIENDNLTGVWTGRFDHKEGKTIIDFTEDVIPKKAIMKPFVKIFLKKQQKTYLRDLVKALSENKIPKNT